MFVIVLSNGESHDFNRAKQDNSRVSASYLCRWFTPHDVSADLRSGGSDASVLSAANMNPIGPDSVLLLRK